ncbi:MAG TPA: ribonuclease Z [Anaerolineaceae bacterium]|mgnify:CR=1 FL=1|nr:ribonuclease Z [Anaerolineaceae bacterium]
MNQKKSTHKLEAIIVGGGTAIPVLDHSPPSLYLKFKNLSALLDVGPGTFSKLPIYGINPLLINNIFVSHLHPDHVLDLVIYYMIRENAAKKKNSPVNVIGCKGIKNFILQLNRIFPDISFSNPAIRTHEMANDEYILGDIRVRTILTGHTPHSIAFRFDFNNISFVYTSDCIYSQQLVEFCAKADILVGECSFSDSYPTSDHMNAQKIGSLAENAQVQEMFITHCYPQALKKDLKKQISKYFSGPIHITQDGDRINR